MSSNIHNFKSRENLEVFIKQNPRRFLEELERSPALRNNFQELMKEWNTGDLIQIANHLQGKEIRNPINNKLMIVEHKASTFYQWSKKELIEVQQNPYHQLTSFYMFQKKQEEQELEEKLAKEKRNKKVYDNSKERQEQEKNNIAIILKTIEDQFHRNMRNMLSKINTKAMDVLKKDTSLDRAIILSEEPVKNVFETTMKYLSSHMPENKAKYIEPVLLPIIASIVHHSQQNPDKVLQALQTSGVANKLYDAGYHPKQIVEDLASGKITVQQVSVLYPLLEAARAKNNPELKEIMGNINIKEALKNDHNEIKKVKISYENLSKFTQNLDDMKHINNIENKNMESVEKREETISTIFNIDSLRNADRKKLEQELEQQNINTQTHTINKFKG